MEMKITENLTGNKAGGYAAVHVPAEGYCPKCKIVTRQTGENVRGATGTGDTFYQTINFCPVHKAAPDLLETAKAAVSGLQLTLTASERSALVMRIKAAIAKATA